MEVFGDWMKGISKDKHIPLFNILHDIFIKAMTGMVEKQERKEDWRGENSMEGKRQGEGKRWEK